MDNENLTSPTITVKSNDDTRIVSNDELPALLQSEPLYTVVRVKDKEYGYHIILDDINGEKFWQQFSGDIEFVKKSNEWFKNGQKLFEEKPLTADEAAELRECLLAISTLGNFFSWDVQTVEGFLDQLIVTFAHRLFCKHKNFQKTLEELQCDSEFMPYLHATAIFVKAYSELVNEIRQSTITAAEEQSKVDKSV